MIYPLIYGNNVSGLAGTRTQSLFLRREAIYPLIYETNSAGTGTAPAAGQLLDTRCELTDPSTRSDPGRT